MSMSVVLSSLVRDSAIEELAESARSGTLDGTQVTLAVGARRAVLACVAEHTPSAGVLLVVVATTREATDVATTLRQFLGEHSVAVFPSWETLPHERLSPRSDTVAARLAVLRRLRHPDPADPLAGPLKVVVAPVRAALQPLVAGLGDLEPVVVRQGDTLGLPEVVKRLVAAAYTRTDMVERRGEFAVRGGIIDVFPPTEEHPLRLEFWGDVAEEIRWFTVADQRSHEAAELGLWAPPCRELILTDAVRERARQLRDTLPGVSDILDKIGEGIAVEGMEALSPVLVEDMQLLGEVLPAGSSVVAVDPERLRSRSAEVAATSQEFLEASWSNAAAGNTVPVELGEVMQRGALVEWSELVDAARAKGVGCWSMGSFALGDLDDGDHLTIPSSDIDSPRGDIDGFLSGRIPTWLGAGRDVLLIVEGAGMATRMAEQLRAMAVPASVVQAHEPSVPGAVAVRVGTFGPGCELPGANLVIVTETDLTGASGGPSTKDMRRMPSRRRNHVDPLSLHAGDYVVHEQHGVGRFVEMTQRTVHGATREYVVVEYGSSKRGAPPDRLFVPTDQLDLITRYVGGEAPTLNRLGGADWAKTKAKAKKYVKQIAGELIQLYSARQSTKGHAFGPDTPWQRELEDAFSYVETPDQLSSIDEVKADMERPVPMDRLICGDVGYGKTEIAVRAAFKAIQDGKQVAVLCPTTLLAQQHVTTFSERYAQFPVVVKSLSRFSSDKEAKEVTEGLADGSVDLVIGTHRLLSASVKFKDLGLVVVDEEQRFGVEHKEQLKAMRTAVDVLSMSATPIPRTLEMAITGIREMSTLATPPEERHPILTFVGPYDEKQLIAAIRRELLRDGQVFMVHNRVQSIDSLAARIKDLVPEARVATAHGKLSEHELERVVVDFWEKKYDVLVCTTIVETGLDISNANTLIVDRADALGLSQLHQLRGRVGRGRERAYAYFMYPPDKPLTETAHDRLSTIASHTHLGAGMQVAMKDLEIRGAGNLLGGEQSGHIAGVGFDLYVRLVGEAVEEFKSGTMNTAPQEIKIELPINAHIPESYVGGERLRLEAYRKLAAVESAAQLDDIVAELIDRYGALPEPVTNLVEVARLRTVARAAGVSEIMMMGPRIKFAPLTLRDSQQMRLERIYKGALIKPGMQMIQVPVPKTAPVGGQVLQDTAILDWARQLLQAIVLDDVGEAARAATAGRV